MATDLEVAWAAGLFEGEGCLSVSAHPVRGNLRCQARLGSTDRDVVERFAKIIGFGNINRKHHHSSPAHWKPLWEWNTAAAGYICQFIDLMRPYLGERRLARAEEVYAAASLIRPFHRLATHCPNGHPYEGHNVQIEKRASGSVRRCRACRREAARKWEASRTTTA